MDQNTDSAIMSPVHAIGKGDVAYESIPTESSSPDEPAEQVNMPPTYAPSSDLPPSYPPSATPKDRGASKSDDADAIAAQIGRAHV